MKIKSYEIKDSMIKVITDNPKRSEFVYPIDKFDSLERMRAEINASIAFEAKTKLRIKNKVDKLKADLDKEITKNA